MSPQQIRLCCNFRGKKIFIMGFEKKTFAFKLAEKTANQNGAKWKARPEVSAMGCTGIDLRYDGHLGRDKGDYC